MIFPTYFFILRLIFHLCKIMRYFIKYIQNPIVFLKFQQYLNILENFKILIYTGSKLLNSNFKCLMLLNIKKLET